MNRSPHETLHGRREFLRSLVRNGALAIAAVVFSRLVSRRSQQPCVKKSVCNGCTEFVSCDLPQALLTRATTKGARS